MLWALLALVAAFLWGIVNVIDTVLVRDFIKNPKTMGAIVGFLQPLFILVVLAFKGFSFFLEPILLIPIVTGFVYIAATLFYYRSLQKEESSRMIPILKSTPLFVLIMASVFLGEVFTPLKYLGIFLIILGSIVISLKKTKVKLVLSKGSLLMVASVFLFAVATVLTKYGLNFLSYFDYIVWTQIGVFLSGIILILGRDVRKDFSRIFGDLKKNVVGGVLLKEFLEISGYFVHMFALSIGFASLVSAITSTQALFALVGSVVLTFTHPHLLKEKFTKKTIPLKIFCTLLIIIGVWLIVI